MSHIKQILLVEDSPADAEMTMDALSSNNLINEIILVEDGPEALDFGEFASVVASLGVFWAAINRPPPCTAHH